MTRFFCFFLLIIIILFGIETTKYAQELVIVPFTTGIAHVSASFLRLFDSHIASHGVIIWNTVSGFAVKIEEGCNGVEAGLILIAAIISFPSSWLQKLVGIGVGILLVQILNLVRVISLFYLGQWNKDAFEWAHLYLWQALIILDVLVVFLYWMHWVAKQDRARRSAYAAP